MKGGSEVVEIINQDTHLQRSCRVFERFRESYQYREQAALFRLKRRVIFIFRHRRVIGNDGANLGIMSSAQAKSEAMRLGLDLVELNPKAVPPVCKIMNYGQYKYEQEKEARKAKARQKVVDLKGMRLSLRIKGADLDLRRNQAREFLENGDKVRVEMVLRGREKAHTDLAQKIIEDFASSIETASILQPISKQGGRLTLVLGRK